jgi:hypothetical protein
MLIDWLIFFRDDRTKDSERNFIFRCSFIGYFLWGFICDIRERVLFSYDTKDKEHKNTRQPDLYTEATPPRTYQIDSCFDALSITYHCENAICLKEVQGIVLFSFSFGVCVGIVQTLQL